MKIRTIYLKVSSMETAVNFWSAFLDCKPHKRSEYWSELKCGDLNFGLLWMEGFSVEADRSNAVPVFESADDALEDHKDRALRAGASVVVDIADHPDKKSYVLTDPLGNEFEITKFRD